MIALQIEKAARRILNATSARPSLAMVLGSGFQAVLQGIDPITEIPFGRIPGFPKLHVPGHQASIVIAKLHELPLYILSGRAHYYEGHSMDTVTFPIRALAACGIKAVFLTNAAGGINPRFRVGDLMALSDHMNFMGVNPLRSLPIGKEPSFVDLSEVYDSELRAMIKRAARRAGVRLQSGVYMAVAGPSFETPAEIRAFGKLGADAVGMSTVPEAIVARECGLRVAALSCITNYAAGRNRTALSHAEVLAAGQEARDKIVALIGEFVKEYRRLSGGAGEKIKKSPR